MPPTVAVDVLAGHGAIASIKVLLEILGVCFRDPELFTEPAPTGADRPVHSFAGSVALDAPESGFCTSLRPEG